MEIGLNLLGAEGLFDGDISRVPALAAEADRRGFDLISTGDHLGFDADAHAVRRRENAFPFPLEHPWYEPISLLSAVAAVTERAQLGVSVLIAPLRPPVLLAKQIATLDHLSKGRVTIGLGVGWQEAEYTATGMPFEGRFGRMEELVRACRELWTHAPAEFTGRDYSFENFHSLPFPVQDRVPVLFGLGPSPRNFDRIARVADGWTVNPTDLPQFADSVALLRDRFAAHDRDPGSLRVQVSITPVFDSAGNADLDATGRMVRKFQEFGATAVLFRPTSFSRDPGRLPELLDWMISLGNDD